MNGSLVFYAKNPPIRPFRSEFHQCEYIGTVLLSDRWKEDGN